MTRKRNEPISFPIPLSREVERLFDEIIHRPWEGGREARGWNPSMDLYETADDYIVEADLPGVKAENVKVEVQNGDLVIQGKRRLDRDHGNGHFHIMERSSGFFIRQMKLPESVDKQNVQVEFEDGVLRVVLPKTIKGKGKNRDSGGQSKQR
jgi:HSP20 family protein